ncbi:MAG: exosome complex RNA-binding protein Csl4 [Methanocellales archaeon]
MENKFVIPGDFIGTSEEFIAGAGTYEEKGSIFASIIGYVKINRRDRVVSVLPSANVPPVPKNGDVVVGRIVDLKNSMAVVEIARIKGKEDREIPSIAQGSIHISNVKSSYVNELSKEFAVNDIVKAKVIDSRTMRLSTADRHLGVVKAYCTRCRASLKRKNNTYILICPRCERIETRKISEDYGLGVI